MTPEAIWGPHRHNTAARAAKAGAVLVVHDTSTADFGNKPRAGLGKIKRGKRYGFYMHTSVVIAADDDRLPLGVVGLETDHRTGKRKKAKRKKGHGRPTRRQKQLDPTNEGRRWLRGIDHAATVLADTPVVIHVMDSEADAYPLLATLVARNQRFVIRNCHDRCVVDAPHTKLQPVLEAAPQLPGTREIALNRREGSPHPTYRTSHPPRAARTATVAVSAVSMTIPRSESSNLCPHQAVSLNLVRVFEPMPHTGELAVEWKLWTTEPIDTPEQVWAIVDLYRSRWVIGSRTSPAQAERSQARSRMSPIAENPHRVGVRPRHRIPDAPARAGSCRKSLADPLRTSPAACADTSPRCPRTAGSGAPPAAAPC